ncbi:MAG: hypothetical protein ACK56W_13675 [Pirellula sp.]|jgi:hypothetical protein
MNQPNPYETPRLESDTGSIETMSEFGGNACPLCGNPASRWRVCNTIRGKICEGCGAKLWLVLPPRYQCLLVLIGIGITSIAKWFAPIAVPAPHYYSFLLPILPIMCSISIAMQIWFGKIIASKSSRKNLP